MFERMLELLGRPLFKLGATEVTPMRVATVIVIVLAVLWIARIAEVAVRKLASTRSHAISLPTAYALGRMVRYALLVVGMFVALSVAGFDVTSLALLGGAVGIGIGLGLQSLFANFVSGIVLLLERGLKVGDFVYLESGTRGHIAEIAMRYTRIHTNDSVDVLVPNSEFVNGRVTNWTYGDRRHRLHIPFGVAYGSDKNRVKEAGLAAAKSIAGILDTETHQSDVWMVAFGDSSLNFELVVWVGPELATRPARTQAMLVWALDDELRARRIEVPFPQRDLHVRSGALKVVMDAPAEAEQRRST